MSPATGMAPPEPARSLFDRIVNSASDIIAVLGLDGTVLYLSPACPRLTGYRIEELTEHLNPGHWDAALIHPGDRAQVAKFLRRASDGLGGTLTYRFLRKDESYVWIESSVNMSDRASEAVVISRDATARRQTGENTEALYTVPSAMFLVGAHGLISVVNSQMEQLFGYGPGELLGQSPEVLVPPRLHAAHVGHRDAFAGAPSVRAMGAGRNLFGVRRDGCEIPVEVGLDPIVTADGTLVLVTVIDITRRRQAEQHIQLLQTLVEGVLDTGIFMLDPQGYIMSWNEGAARLKGYTADEIVGQHFSRFYPPEAVAAGRPERGLAIARKQGKFEEEGWRVRRDGSRFWASVVICALRDKDGDLLGFSKLTRDFTERKKSEEQLQKSEKSLRELADAMPQIVWTALATGEVDYCNQQWWEFTGSSKEEPGQENIRPILHPDDVQAYLTSWGAALTSGHPYEIQCRFRNRNTGEYRWQLGRAAPLRDESGEIEKWVGTFTDIDDHKRLSEELERRVEERTVALRKSLTETTTLLKEVHHRVKNNLQVICSLLTMQIACSEGDRFIRPLNDALSRVLTMSLIHEQVYQSATLCDLDFGEYIATLSERLFSTYCVDPSRIRLELEVEPILLTMHQAVPCGLILNELIANSLNHAFTDGRQGLIRIALRKLDGGRAELSVADNGVGFAPGFHWDEGQSLGLQVVRALISQLRGTISATGPDTENETGVTFRLSWKLSASATPAD